jgi:mRNA-degrading endonuclease RelE of RelBE toxin-antitoxin system
MSDTGKWEIGYEDEKRKKKIEKEYKSDTRLEKKWKDFEKDVTQNPFYHVKPKRIEKLRDTSFPKGTWRYRKDPIRVVYFPEKKRKIIYPLAVTTTTAAPYKKRSFR